MWYVVDAEVYCLRIWQWAIPIVFITQANAIRIIIVRRSSILNRIYNICLNTIIICYSLELNAIHKSIQNVKNKKEFVQCLLFF